MPKSLKSMLDRSSANTKGAAVKKSDQDMEEPNTLLDHSDPFEVGLWDEMDSGWYSNERI